MLRGGASQGRGLLNPGLRLVQHSKGGSSTREDSRAREAGKGFPGAGPPQGAEAWRGGCWWGLLEGCSGLTCGTEAVHAQVADGEAHDGRLVQMRADAAREGQRVSQLVQHLRLLTAPAARRIPRLLLPQLRARPVERKWHAAGHMWVPLGAPATSLDLPPRSSSP